MLRLDDFDSCEKLSALVKQIREACKLLNPLVLLSISNKVTSWENIVLENGPISRLSPRAGEDLPTDGKRWPCCVLLLNLRSSKIIRC